MCIRDSHCTADGTCYVIPPPIDPRVYIYIGLVILLLAPCLSIAGWTLGNRHWDSTASTDDPRRLGMHTISLVPDGRTVGKLGVVLSIALVLLAAGIYLFFREVFNHIEVPSF